MTASSTFAERHCTSCDTANPADARFCVECGNALGGASGLPPVQHPTVPSSPVGTRCYACGTANPAGAAFCVNCGAGLAPSQRVTYAPSGFAPAYAASGAQQIVQHVYVTNAAPQPIPLIVRALWFLFIGLWLGQLWIVIGWLLNLTIIGLPLGLWMLNRTGHVMTLRQTTPRPLPSLEQSSAPLLVRGVYFLLVGWWASLLWLMFGWFAAATVIGLPLAFLMFERTGTVATLAEG